MGKKHFLCLLLAIFKLLFTSYGRAPVTTEILSALQNQIIVGQTFNFSNLLPYTKGVLLTLNGNPVNLAKFKIQENDVEKLDQFLDGQGTLEERLNVLSRLAGISKMIAGREAIEMNELALEDMADSDDDLILEPEDIDNIESRIEEEPEVLELNSPPPILKEGEITLDAISATKRNERVKRKVLSNRSRRWSKNIPYIITSDFDQLTVSRRAILEGINSWEKETCLRFKEVDTFKGSHLIFKRGRGCYSKRGRRPNGQIISIGKDCATKGDVAHEIGHSLGFLHEQSRPDRSRYVTILEENIKPHRLKDFIRESWKDAITMGVPYDYTSLMHEGPYGSSKAGQMTLTAKEEDMDSSLGARLGLSFFDAAMANYFYCHDKCQDGLTWVKCQNDGYRDPNDCTKCKCPDGWTGRYCSDVQGPVNAECGSNELLATPEWQNLSSPNYNKRASNLSESQCTWRIRVDGKYRRVVMRFIDDFSLQSNCDDVTCSPNYVEIRYKGGIKAGPRYCCTKSTKYFRSHGSYILLLMRITSKEQGQGFRVQYKSESCGWSLPTSSFGPACNETKKYRCDGYYTGRCGFLSHNCTRYRINTCHKDVQYCAPGYELSQDGHCHDSLMQKNCKIGFSRKERLSKGIRNSSRNLTKWKKWHEDEMKYNRTNSKKERTHEQEQPEKEVGKRSVLVEGGSTCQHNNGSGGGREQNRDRTVRVVKEENERRSPSEYEMKGENERESSGQSGHEMKGETEEENKEQGRGSLSNNKPKGGTGDTVKYKREEISNEQERDEQKSKTGQGRNTETRKETNENNDRKSMSQVGKVRVEDLREDKGSEMLSESEGGGERFSGHEMKEIKERENQGQRAKGTKEENEGWNQMKISEVKGVNHGQDKGSGTTELEPGNNSESRRGIKGGNEARKSERDEGRDGEGENRDGDKMKTEGRQKTENAFKCHKDERSSENKDLDEVKELLQERKESVNKTDRAKTVSIFNSAAAREETKGSTVGKDDWGSDRSESESEERQYDIEYDESRKYLELESEVKKGNKEMESVESKSNENVERDGRFSSEGPNKRTHESKENSNMEEIRAEVNNESESEEIENENSEEDSESTDDNEDSEGESEDEKDNEDSTGAMDSDGKVGNEKDNESKENSNEDSEGKDSSESKEDNGGNSNEDSEDKDSSESKEDIGENSNEDSEDKDSSESKEDNGENSNEDSEDNDSSESKEDNGENSNEDSEDNDSSESKEDNGENSNDDSEDNDSDDSKEDNGENSNEDSEDNDSDDSKEDNGGSAKQKNIKDSENNSVWDSEDENSNESKDSKEDSSDESESKDSDESKEDNEDSNRERKYGEENKNKGSKEDMDKDTGDGNDRESKEDKQNSENESNEGDSKGKEDKEDSDGDSERERDKEGGKEDKDSHEGRSEERDESELENHEDYEVEENDWEIEQEDETEMDYTDEDSEEEEDENEESRKNSVEDNKDDHADYSKPGDKRAIDNDEDDFEGRKSIEDNERTDEDGSKEESTHGCKNKSDKGESKESKSDSKEDQSESNEGQSESKEESSEETEEDNSNEDYPYELYD